MFLFAFYFHSSVYSEGFPKKDIMVYFGAFISLPPTTPTVCYLYYNLYMWASKKGPLIKFSLVQLLFRLIKKVRHFFFRGEGKKTSMLKGTNGITISSFLTFFFNP